VAIGQKRERGAAAQATERRRLLAWPEEIEPLFDRSVGAICPWLPFRRRHPWIWRTEESFPDIDVRGEPSRAVSCPRSPRRGGGGPATRMACWR
jgi:hypothetical protein